jgi:hypothetical protein
LGRSTLRWFFALALVAGALVVGIALYTYFFPGAVCAESPCSPPPPSWNAGSLAVLYLGLGFVLAGTAGLLAVVVARVSPP